MAPFGLYLMSYSLPLPPEPVAVQVRWIAEWLIAEQARVVIAGGLDLYTITESLYQSVGRISLE